MRASGLQRLRRCRGPQVDTAFAAARVREFPTEICVSLRADRLCRADTADRNRVAAVIGLRADQHAAIVHHPGRSNR